MEMDKLTMKVTIMSQAIMYHICINHNVPTRQSVAITFPCAETGSDLSAILSHVQNIQWFYISFIKSLCRPCALHTTSWSIKLSIAAQKLATSTLMTAPLKVVTIECIEHDVTCLNERVFIKTVNHLLTNCSQSTLLAMVCRLSLLLLNTS